MKRYLWIFFALGMPLSSPLACGGDGCLRASDCASDQTCRAGKCGPKELPSGEGGAGEDSSFGGSSGGGSSGGGASARAGAAARGGSAGAASGGSSGVGGDESAGGDASPSSGGLGGEGGAMPLADGTLEDGGANAGGVGEPTP